MKSIHALLEEAENIWREEVSKEFPLWADTEVIKASVQLSDRDWEFKTDLDKIFALIYKDESLQKKFESATKHWDTKPEELAKDTLHYLLFHELYHPIEAPFSTEGEDNDNKRIHQAIHQGIRKAEPKLKPTEQLMKVMASQNLIKDFILDNRFYLDNKDNNYVRDDVIPVWDLFELDNNPKKTNAYTITRYLYGVLYGPESTHNFFQDKTKKKGVEVAEKALGSLIKKKATLKKKKSLLDMAASIFKEEKHEETDYTRDIREVFSGEDRYNGIERFIEVLSPYIEKDMPKGRPDQQGEGNGTSSQNILQDLLDGMPEEEQQDFMDSLMQEMGQENSVTEWTPSTEEKNTLELSTIHEFYKRNHPEVRLVGGKKVGESLAIGKKSYFELKDSRIITEDDASRLNMRFIAKFQQRARLPMLIPLGNGLFRLNTYEEKQKEVKDIVYVEESMDIPEVVEIYADSSGSMYNGANNGFNDGSRWDMLSDVVYGYTDALHQAEMITGKRCMVQLHNLADSQISSEAIGISDFIHGDMDMLKVMFKPENGYGHEDLDIKIHNDGKKRTYVVVTDGNLVIGGRTERESRKMKELAKKPENEVILFEIGGSYSLGKAVRNDANIHYYPVYDKQSMLDNGLEVLLSKW